MFEIDLGKSIEKVRKPKVRNLQKSMIFIGGLSFFKPWRRLENHLKINQQIISNPSNITQKSLRNRPRNRCKNLDRKSDPKLMKNDPQMVPPGCQMEVKNQSKIILGPPLTLPDPPRPPQDHPRTPTEPSQTPPGRSQTPPSGPRASFSMIF